jgi:cation transport regulator ChaC
MSWVHYFAYGSNMLRERLRARVPSAVALAVARLDGRRLDFGKLGRDGSGKCDVPIAAYSDANTWGVVYALSRAELARLDRVEGVADHYVRDAVDVCVAGSWHRVQTYLARRRAERLEPFDWYHQVVLAGARQHGLPAHYVDWLAAHRCRPDPDRGRQVRREAEAVLAVCDPAITQLPGLTGASR